MVDVTEDTYYLRANYQKTQSYQLMKRIKGQPENNTPLSKCNLEEHATNYYAGRNWNKDGWSDSYYELKKLNLEQPNEIHYGVDNSMRIVYLATNNLNMAEDLLTLTPKHTILAYDIEKDVFNKWIN